MKIYRYQFKNNGRIIVDEFDCRFIKGIDKFGYYQVIGIRKRISEKELNELQHNNYIMWCLEKDKVEYFLNLVLNKKCEIYDGHLARTNKVKEEIEMIKELKNK